MIHKKLDIRLALGFLSGLAFGLWLGGLMNGWEVGAFIGLSLYVWIRLFVTQKE